MDVPPQNDLMDRRIIKVIEAMNTNPAWALGQFAQLVNLSKSRLTHLFKEHTGLSISECLREKRLNYAAELLRLTELRVKEVAYETGYDHPQSFVRAFKQRYKVTPKIFRNVQFHDHRTQSGTRSTNMLNELRPHPRSVQC